jgi:hypothetical protein
MELLRNYKHYNCVIKYYLPTKNRPSKYHDQSTVQTGGGRNYFNIGGNITVSLTTYHHSFIFPPYNTYP